MNRILGIDYGSARVGISLSDPLKIIASDFEVIQNKNSKKTVDRIGEICIENKVGIIVLGLPINMDGSLGFQAQEVLDFEEEIKRLEIKIILSDERLTTKMAEETMVEMKMSKDEIRKKSDAKAASFILQHYLDFN